MDAKRVIKGIAKTTGKYTCKGIGKGVELVGRAGVKTLDVLVQNRGIQKIATGAGLLAASVMIPGVGVSMIGAIGLKYMLDRTSSDVLKNNKTILDEMNDILNVSNKVTRTVSNNVISPALHGLDKGIKNLGKNYQSKIDGVFR